MRDLDVESLLQQWPKGRWAGLIPIILDVLPNAWNTLACRESLVNEGVDQSREDKEGDLIRREDIENTFKVSILDSSLDEFVGQHRTLRKNRRK